MVRRTATITVVADTLSSFRAAVFDKHGRLYGVLQTEANKALQHWADTLEVDAE